MADDLHDVASYLSEMRICFIMLTSKILIQCYLNRFYLIFSYGILSTCRFFNTNVHKKKSTSS